MRKDLWGQITTLTDVRVFWKVESRVQMWGIILRRHTTLRELTPEALLVSLKFKENPFINDVFLEAWPINVVWKEMLSLIWQPF